MERVEKLATPLTAATVVVPDSVPPPGLVPMARSEVALERDTGWLRASCTVNKNNGAMPAPAVAFEGCTVKARFVAAAGQRLKAAEVAPVRAPDAAVRVYPVPTLSMERLEKVATPLTAATVVVPESVPPPGLVPMAMATLALELVTVFPKASCTVT